MKQENRSALKEGLVALAFVMGFYVAIIHKRMVIAAVVGTFGALLMIVYRYATESRPRQGPD